MDARIQTALRQIANVAEMWLQNHNQYGTDFCDRTINQDIGVIAKEVETNKGVFTCQADNNRYAVSSTLNTGGSWCVDYKLYSNRGSIADYQCTSIEVSDVLGEKFGLTGLYGDTDYDVAQSTKAVWIRPEIGWQAIQDPLTGEYRWDEMEAMYQEAEKRNLKVMLSLRARRDPAFTSCDLSLCVGKTECPHSYSSCPPKDKVASPGDKSYYPAYYDMVKSLAEHFKGRVDYFVIENEVNTLTFWNGTGDDYLKLRATAYKAIHDANPNGKVIDNGIASEAWIEIIARDKFCKEGANSAKNFLIQAMLRRYANPSLAADQALNHFSCHGSSPVLERGSEIVMANFGHPESFDVMSFHFYESWQLESQVISWIKKNAPGKPLMNTEGGYFDGLNSALDEATQKKVGDDIVKLHVVAYAEGVTKWIWLPAVQKMRDGPVIYNFYKGLYHDNPLTKLKAGTAYEIMINKIGQFSSVEKIKDTNHLYIYKFINNGKPVLVAWSETEQNYDVSPYLANPKKATYAYSGEESLSSAFVNLKPEPVFIEQ